jgi:transposase, IS5 family
MTELADMRQLTLASASFDKQSKQTRRAKFLAEMDQVVPWRALCTVVEPFYNQRYRRRGAVDKVEHGKNRTKSKVRAKVKHPFLVIKRVFGFAKVRYRGLAKNTHRLWVSCGLTNLFIARHRLLRA